MSSSGGGVVNRRNTLLSSVSSQFSTRLWPQSSSTLLVLGTTAAASAAVYLALRRSQLGVNLRSFFASSRALIARKLKERSAAENTGNCGDEEQQNANDYDGEQQPIHNEKQQQQIAEKITVYNELKSEGNSLFTHNHFDLAIEKYLQALEACDDQEKWRSVLYHNISSSYLKLDNVDEAMNYCQKSLDSNPENQKSILLMARILKIKGEPDKAIEYCHKLLKQNTHPPMVEFFKELQRDVISKKLKSLRSDTLNISHSSVMTLLYQFISDPLHEILASEKVKDVESSEGYSIDENDVFDRLNPVNDMTLKKILIQISLQKFNSAYEKSLALIEDCKELPLATMRFLLNFCGTCELVMNHKDVAKKHFLSALELCKDEADTAIICNLRIKLAYCREVNGVVSELKEISKDFPEDIDINLLLQNISGLNDATDSINHEFLDELAQRESSDLLNIKILSIKAISAFRSDDKSAMDDSINQLKKQLDKCDSYIYPHATTNFLDVLSICQDFSRVPGFLTEALSNKKTFTHPSAHLFCTMANVLAEFGQISDAMQMIDEAMKLDKYFDEPYQMKFALLYREGSERKSAEIEKLMEEFARNCPYSPFLENCLQLMFADQQL